MNTYRNPWHRPGRQWSGPSEYTTGTHPEHYRGYDIYHREREVWDVVINGECVAQRAGLNGARQAVDEMEGRP